MNAKLTIVRPGMLTTVQDYPGRVGYWQIGVPPSGPMDDLSFRLGNTALGNPEGAPGIECAMAGPAMTFDEDTTVCITGAPVSVTVDGVVHGQWRPVLVPAGSVLDVGTVSGPGLRIYVLVQGGIETDDYLAVRRPSPWAGSGDTKVGLCGQETFSNSDRRPGSRELFPPSMFRRYTRAGNLR